MESGLQNGTQYFLKMKYFQMMPTQLPKEICQYPVTKPVSFFGIFICLMSCKTLQNDAHYKIINTVLDNYAKQDSIYLYPKIVALNDKKIEELETYGIDTDTCNAKISDIILNADENPLAKNNTEEKWNYSKIKNPKIITQLKLKNPESIARYEKLTQTIKDEYELLDRKFMLWTFEHSQGMLRLSFPFYNNDRSYALVYVSRHNNGEFVLTLKQRAKKDWAVICEKRLSHY